VAHQPAPLPEPPLPALVDISDALLATLGVVLTNLTGVWSTTTGASSSLQRVVWNTASAAKIMLDVNKAAIAANELTTRT
jgi:hypothetical protein